MGDYPHNEALNEEEDFKIVKLAEALTMFRSQNLYERLGVTSTASATEISNAYKALQRKYHPDKHGHRTAAIKEMVGEMAHLVSDCDELRDDAKRQAYDKKLRSQAGSGGHSSAGKAQSTGPRSERGVGYSTDFEKEFFTIMDEVVGKFGREFLEDAYHVEALKRRLLKFDTGSKEYAQTSKELENAQLMRPYYLAYRKAKGWGNEPEFTEREKRQQKYAAKNAEKAAAQETENPKMRDGGFLKDRYASVRQSAGKCLDCSNRQGAHHLYVQEADGTYKQVNFSFYSTAFEIKGSSGTDYVVAESYSARTGTSFDLIDSQTGAKIKTYKEVKGVGGKFYGLSESSGAGREEIV